VWVYLWVRSAFTESYPHAHGQSYSSCRCRKTGWHPQLTLKHSGPLKLWSSPIWIRAPSIRLLNLRGALAPVVSTNHAAIIEPARIGELLRSIECYKGQAVTWYALRIAPFVFVRPGELRHAEWSEFDLDGGDPQWRIPAEKMKLREQHIVPLSKQVVKLLRELNTLTGNGMYLFPALTTTRRCMSENTINLALRRMGYT
jgi:integrase